MSEISDYETDDERQPLIEPLNSQRAIDRAVSESSSESEPPKHATTNFQTFLHILKGNVGPGILALPLAIRNGGWLFGPIALLIIAAMAIHCMELLVRASRHFCSIFEKKTMDYGEVAQATLHTYGSVSMRSNAGTGAKIVNTFVIIAQFGFCCTYFIFISRNLKQFIHDYGSQYFIEFTDLPFSQTVITICLAFPICVICSVRNLDNLSFWSLLANVASMFSLGVIYYYLFTQMACFWKSSSEQTDFSVNDCTSSNDTVSLEPIQDFGHLTLFFGAAIFAFEGITVVLPLENSMKNPGHFPKVLKFGMTIVTMLFFTMGVFGYIAIGDAVEPSITLNLPNTGSAAFLYSIVKLSYSFVVFISFALQFYVPVAFLWPWVSDKLFNRYKGRPCMIYLELCFRYFLVLVLCMISVIVPHLGHSTTKVWREKFS